MYIEYRDVQAIERARKIQREAADLHMVVPPLMLLDWEIKAASGEVIERSFGKSNSFTRNAYNWFCNHCAFGSFANTGAFQAGDCYSWKDTGNTNRNNGGTQSSLMALKEAVGAVNDSTYGIQVGSGNNAYSFENHVLQTLITHGTGAGQLQYAAGARSTAAYNSGNKTWTCEHTRLFSNGSGGDVTIREVGLSFRLTMTNLQYNFLFSRDLLPADKVLAAGSSVTYKYTIEYVFPA